MGQSTNAILFYGFVWDCEQSEPPYIDGENSFDGWEERYTSACGFTPPTDSWFDAKEKFERYWKMKSELIKKGGVIADTHCSCECPMPYVCVQASQIVCHRGDFKEITSLEVKPEWNDMLKDFCDKMKIDVGDMTPKWFMVSDWN